MYGSGLMNLFETVYASTAVSHMLSGKAIGRTVRDHFLVDTAHTALMLSNIMEFQFRKLKHALKNVKMKTIARLMILLKFKFMTHATLKKFLKLLIC